MLLFYLFLLFTVGPLTELSLLYYLGMNVGWVETVSLVLLTGIVGAALARWQGVVTLLKVQQRMAQGQMPADELTDGLLILIAGIVLVTPGILTDLLGFSLLVPPFRSLIKRGVRRWAKKHMTLQAGQTGTQFWSPGPPLHQPEEILEAEVIETRVVD